MARCRHRGRPVRAACTFLTRAGPGTSKSAEYQTGLCGAGATSGGHDRQSHPDTINNPAPSIVRASPAAGSRCRSASELRARADRELQGRRPATQYPTVIKSTSSMGPRMRRRPPSPEYRLRIRRAPTGSQRRIEITPSIAHQGIPRLRTAEECPPSSTAVSCFHATMR